MKEAEAGIGSPTKYAFDKLGRVLNLAKRIIPQVKYRKVKRIPALPISFKEKLYKTIEGTTPKEIASARESNSFPNSVLVFVSRAILPSRVSKMAAIIIHKPAVSNFPLKLLMSARKPQ